MHGALCDLARKRRFDGSSCQEQRVCDAEWQARCHEEQCEEYQVNACHVHYSLVDCTGCFGRFGCNDHLPLVVGGGSVGRTVASEVLDCFWYAAILRATGSLRSKARWMIDTRNTSSLSSSSKARWHMTPPSAPA
jgi:hypothetical protein